MLGCSVIIKKATGTSFRFMNTDNNNQPFDEFLCRLEPDEKFPAAQYRQLRRKLIKYFAWRKCEDPETLADETITRLVKNVNKGPEIRAANPYAYVYGVAKNIFREYVKEKQKDRDVINRWEPSYSPVAETVLDCRRLCMESLSEDKVELLMQYLGQRDRQMMAGLKGISVNALRLQIHRIKNEIRDCYEKCLQQSNGKRN